MIAVCGHGSRRLGWAAATVAFLFLSLTLIYNRLTSRDFSIDISRASITSHRIPFTTATEYTKPWLDFYFSRLQSPSVLPDTSTYSIFGGQQWSLTGDIPWRASLGKDLCIVDFDDRIFNASGQVFGPHLMTWNRPDLVHGLSLGILNHWLYSKIHGYKYYYIVANSFDDRRTSWKKPTIMSKTLKKHQACIYIDSDALFRNLDLPFEWLMNYWRIGPASNSLALALDPKHEWNQDEFGKEYLNTGFLVAQNNKKAFEILDAWEDCPNEGGRYPECTKFRSNHPGRPTDQGGFGTYVRYDYVDEIKQLPCDEANGYPESHSGCDGTFIRHLWTGKDGFLKIFAGGQMPGPYLEYFHREFVATMAEFMMSESELMGVVDDR